MDMLAILGTGYTSAAVAIGFMAYAYTAESMRPYLISEDPNRSADIEELKRDIVLNTTVSVVLITAVCFGLRDWLFYTGEAPVWVLGLEALAVLYIYDFSYYFVHRYLFHEWNILRNVHAVHHAARNPRTVDSLLLHPVETVAGLALLFGSILAVGGIHLWVFAPIFVIYTTLNVLNHAGVNIPHFPFKTMGVLAVKHDKHHHSMLSGNYASITPVPDMVFGTVE
jgi:sterol desaturase/sphingolipid hydroxylase (fatty acid hydroxylase superfamily)